MVGGGGYTMRNVSRCWAFETGLAAGVELGSGKLLELVSMMNYRAYDLKKSR